MDFLRTIFTRNVWLATLAARAEEGRAPALHEAADARAAGGARLAFAVVDAPVAFVAAAVVAALYVFRVNIHRRAVSDCFREDAEDGAMQAKGAEARERGGDGEGIDARDVQSLCGVDVAETRDPCLVEQRLFQSPTRAREDCV